MDNIKVFIIFLTCALVSSDTFSTSQTGQKTCKNLLNKISLSEGENRKTFKVQTLFTQKDYEELIIFAQDKLELPKSDIKLLKASAQNAISKLSKESIFSLVVYSKSLNSKNRKEILTQILKLSHPEGEHSGSLKKFFKVQKSIDKKTQKEYQKIHKKLLKSDDKLSSIEVYNKAKQETVKFRRAYEKMSYGCRSNIWTEERKAARQAFLKFKLGIGLATSVAGYSYQNQDKFKEDKTRWASKLGYELTFSIVSTYISTGIIANPSSSILVKSGAKYLNARILGLVDWGLYAKLFGGSEEEAKRKIQEILNDKEKMKLIKELSDHLKTQHLYNKYKQELYNLIKPMLIHNQMSMKIKNTTNSKAIDWKNLTEKDLDRPEVMDALVKASLAEMYEDSRGDILSYGSVGADRFVFHAGYGALLLPRDIGVDLYIYHILCMGGLNPKAAFIKALGVYSINRVVFDQLYYFSRRETINQ